MPKRRYSWWPNVIHELRDPGSVYVARALKNNERYITKWDYDILIDCLVFKYQYRKKTIFQIAVDHGTTEWVAWSICKKFIFAVSKEMGYTK